MLHTFPIPYPDELLYSLFSRYHIHEGNDSPKVTTEELFGRRTVRSVLDLPANLDALIRRLGYPWTANRLIHDHTMYPYYASFLLPEQASDVRQAMLSDKGATIHTRIGVNASNIKRKATIWMCEECAKENLNLFGEMYWHRIHQAPGVLLCPNHTIPLSVTNLPINATNQHEYIAAYPEVNRQPVELSCTEEELHILLKIARMSDLLFRRPFQQATANTLRERYLAVLKEQGYASLNGYLKREKLYQGFTSHFSPCCLELLQSPVTLHEGNWLTMIFQNHRKSFHPIRHLLVLLFLGLELEDLLEQGHHHPFGEGPWPCLNIACQNYQKDVVTSLTISRDYQSGNPIGTFTCDCGFIFARRGPDRTPEDRYRIGRMKAYGKVWEDKLAEMIQDGHLLNEITNALRANQETIKRYALKQGLDTQWKAPRKYYQKTSSKDSEEQDRMTALKIKEAKCEWLRLQTAHPQKLKTELRKLSPAVFAILYKYEREWLNANSPAKEKRRTINNRVDWEERDSKLVEEAKQVIETWVRTKESKKPQRITLSSIAREIGKSSLLQKHADKFPKTLAYIRQVTEDTEAFQKRRVIALLDTYRKTGQPLEEWKIYREAGLPYPISDELRNFISAKVIEYNQPDE